MKTRNLQALASSMNCVVSTGCTRKALRVVVSNHYSYVTTGYIHNQYCHNQTKVHSRVKVVHVNADDLKNPSRRCRGQHVTGMYYGIFNQS